MSDKGVQREVGIDCPVCLTGNYFDLQLADRDLICRDPLVSYNASPDWGPWSRKAGVLYAHAPSWALSRVLALRLHLDESTSENGPLRVIPGSHASGVLTDDEVFSVARRREPVGCFVPRGGVLAMSPLLIHSSSKARADEPRRVLHIEYTAELDLGDNLRLAVA